MSAQTSLGDRVIANRRLLVATYATLGIASVLAFMSQVNLSLVAFASRLSGLGTVLIATPAIVPYVLPGFYAWQLISERRLGLYLFLGATALGTVAANAAIMGMFGTGINVGTLFWYTIGQTGAYGIAAEFLLRIEWP